MSRIIPSLFLHVLLLLTHHYAPAHAFANFLRCFVELDDTEVIMNYPVVNAAQARHDVQIAVRRHSDTNTNTTTSTEYVDNDAWTTGPLLYAAGQVSTFDVRLQVPSALVEETVQYVVETSVGGSFPTGSMCEGRRASAPHWDQPVTLQIDSRGAAVDVNQVTVWAGWATGHEAVTLTHNYVFLAAAVADDDTDAEPATEL